MAQTAYNCEFAVQGMHCAACELVIEKELGRHQSVEKVDAVLSQNKVKLKLAPGVDAESVRGELSKLIEDNGYTLLGETPGASDAAGASTTKTWRELGIGFAIAAVIMTLFLLLQKTGLLSSLGASEITLPFVFLIGVIASLSTCMAVVGGLCISISSSYAKAAKLKPLVAFHISRLVGFFILGGVIGLLGTTFTLTTETTFILNLILFFVMLIMGINLLDILPGAKKLQLKLPKKLGRQVLKLEERRGLITAAALGAVTFFLPCGFTQSMQLYSLGTGSFLNGAVTMFVFALGTLPVLGLISVASVKLSRALQSGIFFKTAGVLVLFFAMFSFISALVAAGLIAPVFNL